MPGPLGALEATAITMLSDGQTERVERRRLGASGLEVSVLSLGAMTFGSGMPPVTTVDERDARAMVDRALGGGREPHRHRRRLRVRPVGGDPRRGACSDRRDDVLVATKCRVRLARRRRALLRRRRRRVRGQPAPPRPRPHRPVPAAPTRPHHADRGDPARARRPGRARPRARDRHQQLPGLGDVGRGGAPARARPSRVHRRAALLLAGRAGGRARAHPASAGPTTSA